MKDAAAPSRLAGLSAGLRYLTLAAVVVAPSLLGAGMAYFVSILAIGLTLVQLLRAPARLRPEASGALLLAAFGLFALMSGIVAIVNQRPGELAYVFNFLALALFVPLHAWMSAAARPGNARRFALLALAGTLVCLALAVYETGVLGDDRAGARTVDPIRFGATAMILGFLALTGIRESRGATRWLCLAGPVAGIVALMLSGSRGAMLAVPVLATVAAFHAIPDPRRALAAIAAVAIAGVIVVAAAEALGLSRLSSLVHTALQIFGGQPPDDAATGARLAIYRAALAAFAESPWIGHGWSQITIAPQPYFFDPIALPDYSHLHNDVLDLVVATGMPGVVIYALLIAAPVAGALASPRDSQRRARLYGTTVLSLAYLVCGQSSLMFGFEYQTMLYVGLAAIVLGYCRDVPAAPLRETPALPRAA